MFYIRILVGLFFDLRLVKNRRRLQAIIEIINVFNNVAIVFAETPEMYFYLWVVDKFVFAATNAVRGTWRQEQSTKDVVNGQGDLLSIWLIFEIIGKCLGAIILTKTCETSPKVFFWIQALSHLICAFYIMFFLTDELDENMQERGKDPELLKYEAEQRLINPERYGRNGQVEAPNIAMQAYFKIKSVFIALQDPL